MQINDHIPNLVGGITQQPPETRIKTAVDEMVNAYPSAIQGLSKRRGAQFVASLSSAALGSTSFHHTIDRDEFEKYIVIVNSDGTVEVYDTVTGVSQTVEVDNRCAGYLASSDPSTNIRAVTAGDFTFLANRSKTVQRSVAPVGAPEDTTHYLEFRRFDTLSQNFEVPSVTEGQEAYNVELKLSFAKTVSGQQERFTIDPIEGVRKALTTGDDAMARYEFGYDWLWVSGTVPIVNTQLTAPFTTNEMTLTAPSDPTTSMVNRWGLEYTAGDTTKADPFAVYPKIYTSSSYGNAEAVVADTAAVGDVEIPFLRTRRNAVQGFFINIGTDSATGDGARTLVSSLTESSYKVGYGSKLKLFEEIDADDSINVLDPDILDAYASLLTSAPPAGYGISGDFIDDLQSTASGTRAILLHSENDPQDLGLPQVTYADILANRIDGYTETFTDSSSNTHTVYVDATNTDGVLEIKLKDTDVNGDVLDSIIVAAAERVAGTPYPVPVYNDNNFQHPNTKHEIFFPTREQEQIANTGASEADQRQKYDTTVLLGVEQELDGVVYIHEVTFRKVHGQTDITSTENSDGWESTVKALGKDGGTIDDTAVPWYTDSDLTLGTKSGVTFVSEYDEGRNSIIINTSDNLTKFTVIDVRQESGSSVNNNTRIDFSKQTVTNYEDLPERGSDNAIIRVIGQKDDPEDDFFVQWNGSSWIEALSFGHAEALDALSMPQVLVRTSAGGWALRPFNWSGRLVGDSISNETPSFVSQKISDVFLFQGRLGVCAGESIVLSEVEAYENFYRSTCIQLEDDDRIDVELNFGRVEQPHAALAVQDNLILFSDKGQFRLYSANDVVTPKTASVIQIGDFKTSTKVRPHAIGKSAFFTAEVGGFTVAREFYLGAATDDRLQSSDLTIQCPQYIAGEARYIQASRDHKIIFVLARDEPESLYVYKFEYDGERKIQSAWCQWDLGIGTIESIGLFGNDLYVVSSLGDERELTKIDIRDQQDITGTELLRLDMQYAPETADVTYYANGVDGNGEAETRIDLPFDITNGTDADTTDDVNLECWNLDSGHTIPIDRTTSGGNVFLKGDFRTEVGNGNVVIGVPYEMDVKLSTIYRRAPRKPQGEIVVSDGRLTLNYLNIAYSDTVSFSVETSSRGRDTKTVHAGPKVGYDDVEYGEVPKTSGFLRVPIMTRSDNANIRIKNGSPFASTILHVDWFGKHNPRARRV